MRKAPRLHWNCVCHFPLYTFSSRVYTRHVHRATGNHRLARMSLVLDISHCLERERIVFQAGRPSIIWHPSSLRFCAISLPRRTHSYRSAHSRHTAGDYIAAGGESIFIRPEIDRPRNESPHREGARIAASSRRAPPSSMRLHQPICISECAACDKHIIRACNSQGN